MSDTESETLIHFTTPALLKRGESACGQDHRTHQVSSRHGDVTCFACRKSPPFLTRQGVEAPTPLKLSGVMARSEEIAELGREARRRTREGSRNDSGMFTIEEVIHHGEYRSVRRVEVYAINAITVDAVLQSSAYGYGSWLNPDNPEHKQVRNTHLHQLVDDLKHGRTNRAIGWSTFRTI